mgnify:CR=1 FL=1
MNHKITVFRGDGIGPELVDNVLKILKAANAPLEYEIYNVGEDEWKRNGALIPEEAYASFERTKVLLKSPITTPVGKGFRSLNVTLRGKYDLYANIRPVKSNDAVKTPFKNVDIVIFRENTEGLYVGKEEQIDENTVHAIKIVTKNASERIIRDAFEYAKKNGRKKVTCVHKANILKMSDGMFLAIFREVAKDYPEVTLEHMLVDNSAMQLVKDPKQFDVILTENMFGDILSDEASMVTGSIGMLSSASLNETKFGLYEPSHGSAPDIAGQDKANPIATILSAAMMLRFSLDMDKEADAVEAAVQKVLTEGYRTGDIMSEGCKLVGTKEMGDLIAAAL